MGTSKDIQQWIADLAAAGWLRIKRDIWQAPSGALHRGPYGAWCALTGCPVYALRSCSWCHTSNPVGTGHCSNCGHRADVSRAACDCSRCNARRGPR